jgi:predicted dehydrogenase
LRIIGTEGTIVWNGGSEICFWEKKVGTWETLLCKGDSTNLKGYDGHVAEEPYVREIEDFLSAIARKTIPQFTLSDELKINLLLSRLSGEL